MPTLIHSTAALFHLRKRKINTDIRILIVCTYNDSRKYVLFTDGKVDQKVNFVLSTRETISNRSVPSSSMSMHHGRGRYSTWSGYSMSMSTTEVVQRTEGTIAVDIIDSAQNQLVWEAAATGRVTDSTRQNIEQVAHDAIADIFVQFP